MASAPTLIDKPDTLSEREQSAFHEIADNFHTTADVPPREGVEHDLISQTPQQLANFKSSESFLMGVARNVKSKFSPKELFGTGFVILYVSNQINNFFMGKANNEIRPDGTIAPAMDIGRMINSGLNALISTWTFFSTRAAQVPEGENIAQRTKYAMENMDKCQVQVRDALALSGGITSTLEHFMKGFRLSQRLENNRTLKAGGAIDHSVVHDNTRIAQGIFGVISNALNIYALFGPEAARKKRKEEANLEENAHKLANFEFRPFKEAVSLPLKGRIKENTKTIARFFKDNPILMLNSLVGFCTAAALNLEGRGKQKAQDRLYGGVKDFGDMTEVAISAKRPDKKVKASQSLFESIFGMKEFNTKINALAAKHGIQPDKGDAKAFLTAFCENKTALQELNGMIPDARKALGEAGRRAIRSSYNGLILNGWGLSFRAHQVLKEDKVAMGLAR